MAQLTCVEVEPQKEMVKLAEEMLKNYCWMVRKIEQDESYLQDAGEGTVGSYGDPNAGIRAAYKNSDKTGSEVVRRDRRWQRLRQMKEKVALFEKGMEKIVDDREWMMLDCLLDGTTVTDIAGKMRVSRQFAQDIKKMLIHHLAWAMQDNACGEAA